ncbi:unnamed protein product [Musa banksii]
MDLTSTSFLFSFLVLLVSLLLLKKKRSGRGAPLPPGPSKLPIIGSLHHLLGGLPHRSLTALSKKFGPVILLKLGEVPTLVVSSTEAAAEIMKTHDVSFASRPTNLNLQSATYGDRGVGFTSYGFHWRELRKMSIVELLSAKRVQSFRFIREEEVLNLVRSIVLLSNTGSTVNLSKKLVLLANDIGSRSVIGSKCKYQKEFIRIVMQTLEAAGGFSLADLFPSWPIIKLLSGATFKMQILHRDMDAILNSIIQERRERKSAEQPEEEVEEALVDVMLRVQAEGSLSFPLADEDMKAMMLDMLGGASETSAGIMEWAMSELMKNPRVMRRLQEEVRETVGEKGKVTEKDINGMNYLKLVIKETLRLHPPVPLLLPRECRETCEVLGYQIPEKTRVFVNVWALGRDPRYWDNPTEFEPERFERRNSMVDFKGTNFEFLPFGAGRRICPGMSFGLKSIELSLASLLYNFDWELPSGDEGMPQECQTVTSIINKQNGQIRRAHVQISQEIGLIVPPTLPLPVDLIELPLYYNTKLCIKKKHCHIYQKKKEWPLAHRFHTTMDFTNTCTSFLFSFLVLLVSLLLLKKNRSGRGARATLPPGPSKLPIIGSLHHLLGGLPHRSLTALSKKFGPVILLKLGEVPTLVVSSTEAAAEIMKTHDVSFASRPTNLNLQTATYGDRGVGFTSYGFHWRELRKMSIVELLSAKRVQSFRFIREEEVLNLVRSIVLLSNTGSTVNLSKKLVLLANDIGSRSVIGSKCKYQKEFIRIVMQTLEAAGGFSLADLFPSWPIIKLLSGATFKMQMLHRDMDAILNSIIQERRERKSAKQPEEEEEEEALVDVMLRVQTEGSLSFPLADEDMKAMMLDMLGGASETSAGIMEWAMSELMRNPRVMRRLQEEVRETVGEKGKVTEKDINGMNYLKLVIKETLRLHPPVPLLLPESAGRRARFLVTRYQRRQEYS